MNVRGYRQMCIHYLFTPEFVCMYSTIDTLVAFTDALCTSINHNKLLVPELTMKMHSKANN